MKIKDLINKYRQPPLVLPGLTVYADEDEKECIQT